MSCTHSRLLCVVLSCTLALSFVPAPSAWAIVSSSAVRPRAVVQAPEVRKPLETALLARAARPSAATRIRRAALILIPLVLDLSAQLLHASTHPPSASHDINLLRLLTGGTIALALGVLLIQWMFPPGKDAARSFSTPTGRAEPAGSEGADRAEQVGSQETGAVSAASGETSALMSPAGAIRALCIQQMGHTFIDHLHALSLRIIAQRKQHGIVIDQSSLGAAQRFDQLMRTDGAPAAIRQAAEELRAHLVALRPQVPSIARGDQQLQDVFLDNVLMLDGVAKAWIELLDNPDPMVSLGEMIMLARGAVAYSDLILGSRRPGAMPIHLSQEIAEDADRLAVFPRELLIYVSLGMLLHFTQRISRALDSEVNMTIHVSVENRQLFLSTEVSPPPALIQEKTLGEDGPRRALDNLIAPYGGTVREEGKNCSRVVVTLPLPPVSPPPVSLPPLVNSAELVGSTPALGPIQNTLPPPAIGGEPFLPLSIAESAGAA